MGVVSGDMFIQGRQRDDSFQRKPGYVQQQDLHLETSTVRESLTFSALLRQSRNIPKAEKLAYVEEVIKLLDMQDFAEAVVGVPGYGLNVEQRKRLTIGVELAAKPDLLLFLDEPTSGLYVFFFSFYRRGVIFIVSNLLYKTQRLPNGMVDLQAHAQTGKQWPSRPLHHPPTLRHPNARIRPSPLPRRRGQNRLLW